MAIFGRVHVLSWTCSEAKVSESMFPNRVQMLRCLSFRALRVAALVFFCVGGVRAQEQVAREAMRWLPGQCLSCHNAEKHKGGLDMTSREKLFAGAESGAVIDTNKVAASLLLKVLEPEADPHMPPKKQLTTNQITVLSKWVAGGAPWDSAALAEASAPRSVKIG